jgi:hypothetical protein
MADWIDDIAAEHDHEILRVDGFDDCCVGLVERFGMPPVLLYDKAKMITKMVAEGMSEDDAEEFYAFNQIGAWLGDGTPVFLITESPQRDPE